MKYILLICMILLSACQVTQPERHEQTSHIDISNYKTLSIGKVHFAQASEYPNIEDIFAEKIKTEIFKQQIGHAYLDTPNANTIIISPDIEEYSNGQANMQIMFAVAGRGKVYGTVKLENTNKQTLFTMKINEATPPVSAFGLSSFANGDYLMDLAARDIVKNTINIMKGDHK